MIYLIGQLAIWLLLTAVSAGVAGWTLAASYVAPKERASRREREKLLRDLTRFADDGGDDGNANLLDGEASQRLLQVRDGRIAELERALESARSRADELGGELAEFQRGGRLNDLDAEELERLRAREGERERTVDAVAEPVEDENVALQAWRLRYFEQRVNYLESKASSAVSETPAFVALVEAETAPQHDWSVREANARAAFLENELRTALAGAPQLELEAPADAEAAPFAANADVDMLLRWRLLYLERRVAHLQAEAGATAPLPPSVTETAGAADFDRWKWRARYLEARVRHLESRPLEVAATPAPEPALVQAEETEPPAPLRAAPLSRRAKPPVLPSARNGAPDDLTLIEGVSLLQQTTLYSLGIFHFDQIAAWSEENVAWVDQYLRLQGRIGDEEWLDQARDLARDGPAAARRAFENEDA